MRHAVSKFCNQFNDFGMPWPKWVQVTFSDLQPRGSLNGRRILPLSVNPLMLPDENMENIYMYTLVDEPGDGNARNVRSRSGNKRNSSPTTMNIPTSQQAACSLLWWKGEDLATRLPMATTQSRSHRCPCLRLGSTGVSLMRRLPK
jgi:hypothetical protein